MNNKFTIAVLGGDGVGKEIMPYAIAVLNTIADKYQHYFDLNYADIGGTAYDKYGVHFPVETQHICQNANAILLGSVGGPIDEANFPKWKNCERNSILALRKYFQFNSNIRPIFVYPELRIISPLKDHLTQLNIDLVIIRELIGDIYFGEHKHWIGAGKRYASDVAEYNEDQIAVVAHHGFQLAQKRKKKLTSVDKANVLDTSKLWREVVQEVASCYPEIEFESMLVDNCAMQLFMNPAQFDVILTSNLFGDILSDAAAALPGSLGLIPSASLNSSGKGLYEPAGGSAPDIAGKNIANPIAQILSVAMMLRHSFEMEKEAKAIEAAVSSTLQSGCCTSDIALPGIKSVSTSEMAKKIIDNIKSQ